MGLKHHTIILVPHSRARFRKFRVSSRQLRIFVAAVALLTLTVGYLTWAHFTTTVDLDELARLRSENGDLRRINGEFEDSVRRLQGELSKFEDQANSLAIVAGLSDAIEGVATGGTTGPGAGGGDFTEVPGSPADIAVIDQRARLLQERLATVDEKLRARDLWISAQPAITPVKGIFTSFFGMRKDPLTQRQAFHQGVDISSAPGTPVRAAADGVVIRAGRNGSLGRSVYVSHGYGLTTRYGHLATVDVTPGQRIRQGDGIGTVGNSGRTTGYHLHYEVRVENRAKNPLEFILDR